MSRGRGSPVGWRIPEMSCLRQKNASGSFSKDSYRSSGGINNFLCGQITFVAYEEFIYILTRITFDFLEPLLHVVEGLLVRAVVHNDDAMRPAVVAGSYCSEAFLASSLRRRKTEINSTRRGSRRSRITYVPDLEFDRFAVEFNGSDLEVNSDGADIALCVGVVSESQQETRLSHPGVADQKQFE